VEKQRIYAAKRQGYFQGSRPDVVKLIPDGPNKILELGCGEGKTLLSAKHHGKASEVVGIDIINAVCSNAELDNYLQGDIDNMSIPYPDEYFDVLICADVFEHLVDPWQALRRVSKLLKRGGTLIVSLPNARDYLMFIAIFLKGSFTYKSEGLFDLGHIRFFCKKDIIRLVEGAGLRVVKFNFQLEKIRKLAWLLSIGVLEQFLVKQYLVVAVKTDFNREK
jgi:2-polyprenyl-3-methyl-5-hydroxy-6-metoxy-1,4-benzoquinol methylase